MNTAALEQFLRNSLTQVEIHTTYGPDIVLKDPLKPGPPSPYLQALKPEITLTFATGNKIAVAPYGKPGPSKWPQLVSTAKVAGVFVGIVAGAWAISKIKKLS